jgi:hypothetical protein
MSRCSSRAGARLTQPGRMLLLTTRPLARSIGDGIPMTTPLISCELTPISPNNWSNSWAAARSASSAELSTGSSRNRSASTWPDRSAAALRRWLCPKSRPTTTPDRAVRHSMPAGRPGRGVSDVGGSSRRCPIATRRVTIVATVARDRPVRSASSARVAAPRSRNACTSRSWLYCRDETASSSGVILALMARAFRINLDNFEIAAVRLQIKGIDCPKREP